MTTDPAPSSGDALSRLTAALKEAAPDGTRRGPAPVERWNPPYCGEIDMRIGADGTWFYGGTPIGRPALVKLFASVLRRDPERFVLVTPVERVGITVEDAPFAAVEMVAEGDGERRTLALRTSLDDLVAVGPDHPLRFEEEDGGGVKPYVLVRGGLWARLTRALTFDLLELGEWRERDGGSAYGIQVGEFFYPVPVGSDPVEREPASQ